MSSRTFHLYFIHRLVLSLQTYDINMLALRSPFVVHKKSNLIVVSFISQSNRITSHLYMPEERLMVLTNTFLPPVLETISAFYSALQLNCRYGTSSNSESVVLFNHKRTQFRMGLELFFFYYFGKCFEENYKRVVMMMRCVPVMNEDTALWGKPTICDAVWLVAFCSVLLF